MKKHSNIFTLGGGFFGERMVYRLGGNPESLGGAEKPTSRADYEKRYEEILASLEYVANELPAEDLPDDEPLTIHEYLDRERLKNSAKKALKQLKYHKPEDIPEDQLPDHMKSIERVFDRYMEQAKGGTGVPIGGEQDSFDVMYDYDEEMEKDQRVEKTVQHAVGRVMESWLTGLKATIGKKEVMLKKIEINSVDELEKTVAEELGKSSNKELQASEEGSSWLVFDNGISFVVYKENGNYDVTVDMIDRKKDTRYAALADELDERIVEDWVT